MPLEKVALETKGIVECADQDAVDGPCRGLDSPSTQLIAALAPSKLRLGQLAVPALVGVAGPMAVESTVEFFSARLPNVHTRAAYGRAVRDFCRWLEEAAIALADLSSPVVAAYFQQLSRRVSPASANLNLSALRQWLDWLTVRGVLPFNPASAVRGVKLARCEGRTPVLQREEARVLFDSLDRQSDLIALRDRAVLSLMLFGFVRVGALIEMRVVDFEVLGAPPERRAWLNLREKGGKLRRLPAHHLVLEHVAAYLDKAHLGRRTDKKSPLFQSSPGTTGKLSGRPLDRVAVGNIVKRRCQAVGLSAAFCSHSFRATGITLHQENGGNIEDAARLAGHADTRTTQLYNRRPKALSPADIERVFF